MKMKTWKTPIRSKLFVLTFLMLFIQERKYVERNGLTVQIWNPAGITQSKLPTTLQKRRRKRFFSYRRLDFKYKVDGRTSVSTTLDWRSFSVGQMSMTNPFPKISSFPIYLLLLIFCGVGSLLRVIPARFQFAL